MAMVAFGRNALRIPVVAFKVISVIVGILVLLIVVPLLDLMRSAGGAFFRYGNKSATVLANLLWLIALAIALEIFLAYAFNFKF